jgi:ketosteroid isomerase-like protein
LFIPVNVQEETAMKADAATEAAVLAVLNKFGEAYAKRDVEGLLALVAPDPDVVMYGTGADEKRIGRAGIQAQAERDWAQTEAAALTTEWTSISATDPVAWVAADATFTVRAGGQALSFPTRVTLVLEHRGAQWLIVQGHFSFPAAEQAEGESFPTE